MRTFIMGMVGLFGGSLLTQYLFAICIDRINISAKNPSLANSQIDRVIDSQLWVNNFRFDLSAMIQILALVYMLIGFALFLWEILCRWIPLQKDAHSS